MSDNVVSTSDDVETKLCHVVMTSMLTGNFPYDFNRITFPMDDALNNSYVSSTPLSIRK